MSTCQRGNTRTRTLLTTLSAFAAFSLALSLTGPAEAHEKTIDGSIIHGLHPNATCYEVQVPVSVPAIGNAHIYGRLCEPWRGGDASRTVQLLVPGGTYNHNYFDWPQDPSQYSYVAQALDAGYSTFDVDRLGTGESTLPPSALDTAENGTEALHQVISDLRTGKIDHRAFAQVVWVGHSLGSVMGWLEAQKYHDVDAFVLTGLLHSNEESSDAPGDDTVPAGFVRAMDDPKFRGKVIDPGYLTTAPGVRAAGFFYLPNSSQAVIDEDERLKDVTTNAEAAVESTLSLPPAQAPSHAITVPTLLAIGDHDAAFCGPSGSSECTPTALLASERPYYSAKADLHVLVAASSGHDIQLHENAPQTDAAILDWVTSVSRPPGR